MVFTVLAAVDLNGKCNFELAFPGKPSIAELRARVDRDIGTEAALRRPSVPFAVSRVQVFDERLQMWVDLVAAVQLEDYCQLYVFQVESPYCRDLPGHIPPPQRPAVPASPQRSHIDPEPRTVSPQRQGRHSPVHSRAVPEVPADVSPYRQAQREIELRSVPESPAPAQADKIRMVYDDLDTSRTRKVTLDDWQRAFSRLRISSEEGLLTPETVDDLFTRKADKNQDSIVTFQEFARFAETYPKLLDCLYYRSRGLTHERARKENIERSLEELQARERRLDEARDQAGEQERGCLDQKDKVAAAQGAVDGAQEAEQDAKRARDEAHQLSEEGRSRLREKTSNRDRAREEVRQRDADTRQQQGALGVAKKKLDQKQSDVDRAERELARLRQLLEQQERAAEQAQADRADAERKVEEEQQAVQRCEDAKAEAETKAQDMQRGVSDAEGELKDLLDAEAAASKQHREKQRELQQAQAGHDRELKEEQALQQRADAKKRAEKRAEDAVEEHKKVVEELQDRDQQFDEQRRAEQAKENRIVESEIRLREQRDAVEEKENELSQVASDFAQETGRMVSPQLQRQFGGSPTGL